ncbi:hypothetical protein [Yunchengibacter salinarum]|uniref:hypothetical protein n=1 Tax=Yunchengibacter salinarum TaxID=3133399 RepID=UPI0035B62501
MSGFAKSKDIGKRRIVRARGAATATGLLMAGVMMAGLALVSAAPAVLAQDGGGTAPETIAPSERRSADAETSPPLKDRARFDSSNFMRRLDLFIMEQNGQGPVAPGFSPLSDQDLTLSLRRKGAQDKDGFMTLRDTSRPDAGSGSQAGRPDFSSLYHPDGTIRDSLIGERHGHSSLGLRFGDADAAERDVLSLSLESGYRLWSSLPGTNLHRTDGPFASPLTDREVNLGLSVGYWGFNLDASVLRQTSPFFQDTSGFEAGLSYKSQSWAARLSMSEYRRGADLMGLENEARDIISVELGAVYRLTSQVGLTGSLRYYDYGDRVLTNIEAGEGAQMIFLGGRLEF